MFSDVAKDGSLLKSRLLNTVMLCYRNRQSIFLRARLSRAVQDRLHTTIRIVTLAWHCLGTADPQRSTSRDAVLEAYLTQHDTPSIARMRSDQDFSVLKDLSIRVAGMVQRSCDASCDVVPIRACECWAPRCLRTISVTA